MMEKKQSHEYKSIKVKSLEVIAILVMFLLWAWNFNISYQQQFDKHLVDIGNARYNISLKREEKKIFRVNLMGNVHNKNGANRYNLQNER